MKSVVRNLLRKRNWPGWLRMWVEEHGGHLHVVDPVDEVRGEELAEEEELAGLAEDVGGQPGLPGLLHLLRLPVLPRRGLLPVGPLHRSEGVGEGWCHPGILPLLKKVNQA